MSYDDILTCVGEFGPYYKRAFVLISLLSAYSAFPVAFFILSFKDVSFRCSVPDMSNDTFHIQNEAHQRLVNASIPYDVTTGLYSECSRYSTPSDETSNTTVACDKWVFDPVHVSSSVVPELKLVCDSAHYKAHFTFVFILGFAFAAFFAGPTADTFGRKKPMVAFTWIQSVALIAVPFTSNFSLLFALDWIVAVSVFAYFLNSYTLLIEITGPNKRAWAGLGPMIAWSIGLCLTVPCFYFIKDWRTTVYIVSAVGFLFLTYHWLIPESPRWLLARNMTEEAQKIFKDMAKINKVTLSDELELGSIAGSKTDLSDGRFALKELKPLFRSKVLAVRVFVLGFTWFSLNIVYSATTYSVGSLIEGDIYFNFLMQAVMESLAYLIGFFLLSYCERRVLLCGFMVLSGISFLSNAFSVFLEAGRSWVPQLTYSLGKFGITGAALVIYVQANEVMPTVVRNSAVGLCCSIGQSGGIISPYLIILATLIPKPFGKALPLLIFGSMSAISAILTLLLPDTRNRKLPDTIEEAKKMTKGHRCC